MILQKLFILFLFTIKFALIKSEYPFIKVFILLFLICLTRDINKKLIFYHQKLEKILILISFSESHLN